MFIILQARQLVTSKIDRALQANGFQISFQYNHIVSCLHVLCFW